MYLYLESPSSTVPTPSDMQRSAAFQRPTSAAQHLAGNPSQRAERSTASHSVRRFPCCTPCFLHGRHHSEGAGGVHHTPVASSALCERLPLPGKDARSLHPILVPLSLLKASVHRCHHSRGSSKFWGDRRAFVGFLFY